jgi:uncharacterized protein
MQMVRKTKCVALFAFLGLSLAAARSAPAQPFLQQGSGPGSENIEGLTVAGKGTVNARPTSLEIDVDVAAASELTADAIVKYRDARKKLQEAFTALKLANVKVEERGLLLNKKGMQNRYYMMFGEPSSRGKTEVELSRKLVIKGTELRDMDEEALLQLAAKLLDVAQDAGAKVGGDTDSYYDYFYGYPRRVDGLVRFVLEDFDKLQDEAYEKAMADAKARAQRLARLSDVELGRVVAVRELHVPGETPGRPADDEPPHKQLVANKFQEIPIRVELLVRFEVHPKRDSQAPAGNR